MSACSEVRTNNPIAMKFIPYEQLDFKTGPFIYMYISLRVKQRIQCIVVAIGHAVKITSAC